MIEQKIGHLSRTASAKENLIDKALKITSHLSLNETVQHEMEERSQVMLMWLTNQICFFECKFLTPEETQSVRPGWTLSTDLKDIKQI